MKKKHCGDCKWAKQGDSCVICSHPKAIKYHKLNRPCKNCGRFDPMVLWKKFHKIKMWLYNQNIIKNYPNFACGNCRGRGEYI